MLTSVLGLSLGFGFTKGLFLVSVSDLVSFSFFSESRIQYRIRLDFGRIPEPVLNSKNLVSQNSARHRAKMTVLALMCISATSEHNMTKFQPYLTFMKINLLMEKNWPLKARKAMMK